MSAIFGEILTFGQQNGPDIRLKVFGDEHYARYETLDGYTAIHDDTQGAVLLRAPVRRDVPIDRRARLRPAAGGYRPSPPGIAVGVGSEGEDRRARRAALAGGHLEEEVVRTFGPNQGLLEGRVLATGSVVGLTILVNFQDVTSTVTRADVDAMLNGANYTRNGNICSAREYFRRVSTGKLDYTNVVVGPYTLSRGREFYVDNLLVEEALNARRGGWLRPRAVRLARRGHRRRAERALRGSDAIPRRALAAQSSHPPAGTAASTPICTC